MTALTMTHVEYTDPAIMYPGREAFIASWLPLSDDQRHGWACIACGANKHGMRQVGTCEDGQVFLCTACHDLWASDEPGYICDTCKATTPDDGYQPHGWAHTMDGRDLCPNCRTDV